MLKLKPVLSAETRVRIYYLLLVVESTASKLVLTA